jgi:hypothetical protein
VRYAFPARLVQQADEKLAEAPLGCSQKVRRTVACEELSRGREDFSEEKQTFSSTW